MTIGAEETCAPPAQANDSVVKVSRMGSVRVVTLNRPHKRNALNEAVFAGLKQAFERVEPDVRVTVLAGSGSDFCAGLDLAEHQHREPFESVKFAREGHDIFAKIQFGATPVISVLTGAVIGGGLEIAGATHIRVADKTAYYQLPEGRRGIYVGGGASVRISKIIGSGRMIEMMLTGRKMDAQQGQDLGLSHYLVDEGQALAKAMELADIVAGNAPIPNYMILHAIPHIEDMSAADGLFTESLAQALSLTSSDAKAGIEAFLNRRKISF
jgi:enoyl-CoA hydratase/carnithine racemase